MSLLRRIKNIEAKLKEGDSGRMVGVVGYAGENGANWIVEEQRYETEKGVEFDFLPASDYQYFRSKGEKEPEDLFELRQICNKYNCEISILPCMGCKSDDLWAEEDAS